MWSFQSQNDKFQQYYRCYPVSAMKGDKKAANFGGKIYIPQSALHKLTTLHISYPMLFEIRNEESHGCTHAGVLEFTAEEGRVYLPEWMLANLKIKAGGLVRISSVSLELGTFVKIQPQSVDFLDISDPKSVLETSLRNFTTLTVDDVFQILYNNKVYDIKVLEVKPETRSKSICVVETDLEVDFAAPVGYVEPSGDKPSAPPKLAGHMAEAIGYNNLAGAQSVKAGGHSLRESKASSTEPTPVTPPVVDSSIYQNRDAPALELASNQLFFGFPLVPLEDEEEAGESIFKGEGFTLRKSKKRKDIS
ncbi:Ubiquitin fusion degradation protein 1 [Wickerhamiella sorbophila]|uniref:Ubiquitin fusion degradation protein 1 n=1 Tax=Wickerhamiella sorbophila TaxID=45607 RepID=A0A2T0FNL9_9ASCO|nr:Ubiquitin fusion degradation protein 1 [Wickerhamiella sorbophila]PRT56559.1 Ubiquitin fusion degradation protein 1 [Wickerhamiella sorbophila]